RRKDRRPLTDEDRAEARKAADAKPRITAADGMAIFPGSKIVPLPQRCEQPLDWDENPKALPYLDAHGDLVIPMDCPKKYRWWQGGQSVDKTIRELRAQTSGRRTGGSK